MIIPIDEKRRIVGTERAWELQRARIKKDKADPNTKITYWEPYKYYTTFRQALGEAVQREIRIHPAHGIAEAIEAVSQTVEKFEELIPSEYRLSK